MKSVFVVSADKDGVNAISAKLGKQNKVISLEEGADFMQSISAKMSGCTSAVIVSADSTSQITSIEEFISSSSGDMSYAPIAGDSDTTEVPHLRADNVINYLSSEEAIPAACFEVSASVIQDIAEAQSRKELFLLATLQTVAKGEQLVRSNTLITAENAAQEIPSNREIAATIKQAIDLFNIEDLFPNHPWEQHEEESAAACYHTLAALLLKFGDNTHAQECLALSDRLEDSPRALALRGFVAMKQGETLGAVANLVSSLQQYETRKEDSKEHYLSFSPVNLEQVNSDLVSGLDALNRRDNAAALNFFAQAVFGFDGFYKELGLELKQQSSTEQ